MGCVTPQSSPAEVGENGFRAEEPDSPYGDARITAMGLLGEVWGGLQQRFAVQLAEHHLAPPEFEVLLRLARTPGHALRMSDLAAQTLLTTSGITRVVDRLERDRLVERRACPTDRRGLFASVTEAGLARLDAVVPGHLDMIDHWVTRHVDDDQWESMLTALRIIRDAVRPDASAGAES